MKTKSKQGPRRAAEILSPSEPVKLGEVDQSGNPTPGTFSGETGETAELACNIRRIHYPHLPADFVSSVVRAVESRKMPWWFRLYRWGRSSHSITVTPFHAAPAVALLLLLVMASVHLLSRDGPQQVSLSELSNAVPVTFSLTLPEARTVHVVGSFNGWRPQKTEMKRDDRGAWTAILQLPAGRYEYAFLVDGTKIVPDPRAEFFQDDCFGNRNNMLVVGHSHDTAI